MRFLKGRGCSSGGTRKTLVSGGKRRRRTSRIRVVAAGTFDGIHAGHRYYLRSAKSYGGHLTVIVARDATVPLIKGKRTFRNERQRLRDLAALPEVDRAVLGNPVRTAKPADRFRILQTLQPDVICLGYNQPVDRKALRRFLNTHGMRKTRIVRVRRAPRTGP